MAVSQSDIDALSAVIGSGVLTVKYSDRQITYQSVGEMEKTLARMKAELARSQGGSSYILAATKKGL